MLGGVTFYESYNKHVIHYMKYACSHEDDRLNGMNKSRKFKI